MYDEKSYLYLVGYKMYVSYNIIFVYIAHTSIRSTHEKKLHWKYRDRNNITCKYCQKFTRTSISRDQGHMRSFWYTDHGAARCNFSPTSTMRYPDINLAEKIPTYMVSNEFLHNGEISIEAGERLFTCASQICTRRHTDRQLIIFMLSFTFKFKYLR